MAVEVKRDGAVAVVTVARPEVLNALNRATNEELLTRRPRVAPDAEVRAVVLTGAGEKAFVAGADIAEFRESHAEEAASRRGWAAVCARHRGRATALDRRRQRLRPRRRVRARPGLRHPLRRRRRALRPARGRPGHHAGLGRHAAAAARGRQRLGKYLCLSGRLIDAAEALRIGLVQAVFARDVLMAEALKLAGELAARPPLAVRYSSRPRPPRAERRHRGRPRDRARPVLALLRQPGPEGGHGGLPREAQAGVQGPLGHARGCRGGLPAAGARQHQRERRETPGVAATHTALSHAPPGASRR